MHLKRVYSVIYIIRDNNNNHIVKRIENAFVNRELELLAGKVLAGAFNNARFYSIDGLNLALLSEYL